MAKVKQVNQRKAFKLTKQNQNTDQQDVLAFLNAPDAPLPLDVYPTLQSVKVPENTSQVLSESVPEHTEITVNETLPINGMESGGIDQPSAIEEGYGFNGLSYMAISGIVLSGLGAAFWSSIDDNDDDAQVTANASLAQSAPASASASTAKQTNDLDISELTDRLVLAGADENDIISLQMGDVTVNGGGGLDTVVLLGLSSDYLITRVDNGILVDAVNEQVDFGSKWIGLDVETIQFGQGDEISVSAII